MNHSYGQKEHLIDTRGEGEELTAYFKAKYRVSGSSIMRSVFLINCRCLKTSFLDFDLAVSKLFHLICKMDLIIIQKL